VLRRAGRAGQGAGAVKNVGNDKHSRCFTFYLILPPPARPKKKKGQRVVRDRHEPGAYDLVPWQVGPEIGSETLFRRSIDQAG
jgi:hypothetical protein